MAAGLDDEGLPLAQVDHRVGRRPDVVAQLVETQPPGRTARLRGEPVEQPGVEEEMEVVGDGEGLGDTPEVLAADPGLAGLPPLIVPRSR